MKGIIFILALIAGIAISGVLFLAFWVWKIDQTWSPILESRLQERRQIGSVRVMAKNSKGESQWIGSFTGGRMEERQALQLTQVPPQLVQAIVVLEDPRFLQHGGFDVMGIFRAFVKNLLSFRLAQGGSTITQQLVKNVFLSQEKTFARKFTELVLSALVEKRFSKDEILESYMNEVYLGQLGSVEIHGVGRAAEYYFAKKVDQLEVHEMALLAAVIASPHVYSPRKHPERTKARRDRVLRALAQANLILPEELDAALAKPLPGPSSYVASTRAAYLMDALRQRLLEERGEIEFLKGGFDVNLSLDLSLQEIAEKTLHEASLQWEAPQQAILVAANPKTCEIKAYVGGTDYQITQLDRIRQSKRPIGSLMKPLEISRLLEEDPKLNLATSLEDRPFEWVFDSGHSKWSPENYDLKYRGTVSLRRALEESLNVPISRVFFEREPSGLLAKYLEPVRALGLEIPVERALPSAILGAIDQNPINVLSAYIHLTRQAMGLARDAGDFDCRLRYDARSESSDVFEGGGFGQRGARLTISALEGALRRGTSATLGKKLPPNQAWAGKTGTSSDKRDAWYVALSPDLVILGWVGRDDNKVTNYTGATGPLPFVGKLVENWSGRAEFAQGWSWTKPAELTMELIESDALCKVKSPGTVKKLFPLPESWSPPSSVRTVNGKNYVYELFRVGIEPSSCAN